MARRLPKLSPRLRAYGLHGLWAGLTLGADRLDRRAQRAGAPPGVAMLGSILGWYALIGVLERRRPHSPRWQPTADDLRSDAPFLLMVATAAQVGQRAGASAAGRLGVRSGATAAATRLGIPGGVVASLLTSELAHYSLHRLSHEWGPAWTVHVVHHSPQRLHLYNATRFHPLESVVEGVLEGFGLGLLGLSPSQHLTHATARATYGQLQHANIDLDSGPLDHVFATPDLHRWHHSEIYAEGDNNYGAILSVWDKLFGTFFRPDRALDSKLGVGRMPDFPQTLGGLLATPLRWDAIKSRNAATWLGETDSNPDEHVRL